MTPRSFRWGPAVARAGAPAGQAVLLLAQPRRQPAGSRPTTAQTSASTHRPVPPRTRWPLLRSTTGGWRRTARGRARGCPWGGPRRPGPGHAPRGRAADRRPAAHGVHRLEVRRAVRRPRRSGDPRRAGRLRRGRRPAARPAPGLPAAPGHRRLRRRRVRHRPGDHRAIPAASWSGRWPRSGSASRCAGWRTSDRRRRARGRQPLRHDPDRRPDHDVRGPRDAPAATCGRSGPTWSSGCRSSASWPARAAPRWRATRTPTGC